MILLNAKKIFGQKCIVKNNPVIIWIIKFNPNIEPKFQKIEIFKGVGKFKMEFKIFIMELVFIKDFFILIYFT